MSYLVIDSSVYLSSLLPEDCFHQTSKDFLRYLYHRKQDVILPALIPLEVSHTLQRHALIPEKVIAVYESFYHTRKWRVVAINHILSDWLVKNGGSFNLKTGDWIIAGTCLYFKAQLVTWDQKLIDHTKLLLHTKTPEELLKENA